MRSLHVSDGIMGWDGYDDMPVAALPVEFRMPDIERYTGIGCPRIHLQLYSTVMRGHRLDEAQMIMLFPLSLSGAAQRWFASLDPSRRRTWADLGQEFIRQYSFNTIVDVSRRELEALRQGPDETVTSFISRWREKIAQIIDRPSERDQISMIMRSLQPRFARHLMGFPQTDFGSLVQALYGIEEGISRGLWADSSPSDSKGKKSGSGPRPSDVGTIGMTGHRSSRRPPFQSQFLGTPYQMIQHDQYRPVAPIRPVGPTYLHPPPQPVYATQAPQRPPMQFHHQYRAPPPPRPVRQFTQLGMPLSRAFQRLRAGHDTDSCSALRHAIQDLIDQGLVDLGRPGVATDPLPTHDTRAVPPPPEGVHLIEFAGDEIFMMGWDGEAPQPISLYEESDFVGYIPRQQIPRPFSLTPDRIYGPPPVSPVYLQHVPPMTPFILFPEEYRPPHRDVQIVTRSGRVAQPPPVDRPFAGIAAREEVQREDDEILRQLRTTQARISIWSLLASSSTHRDALVRALGQIRVDTATTPEGLIHMLTADRATCIVRRVPSVLLDNGSALNVCPLVTAIALGFSPDDFGPSTQTVRAYDGTQRTVMGTLSTHVMIGPVSYSIVFQVLRIQSSFNLLLGRPWIHEAGAIPSSLHQKVKFIHEGRIITIQSDRDIITSSEPVLHISHSEDDLHLTGFTFDEVQVVSLEDGSRDMVPMSFDQHSSTLVLSMMRGMSYLPGMGLGRRQQGPHEFTFTVDHDTPYGLGYIPTEADARYMSQLRRDRLADYFIRGSEHTPRTEGTVHIPETVEIQDIQQALGQIHLDTGTTEAPGAMIVTPPSPDRASMFSMCFPDEVPDYDLPMDLGYGTDEMDMIGIGALVVSLMQPHAGPFAFDISGVSVLDDESVLDVVTSDFASVEGASDSVDPPLSFDTMSGFVTRFDDISDGNNDMSIFEYLNVSQHFPLIAPPAPTTHIYDVDDVGDTDDPLGGQSECDSDTEDRKVTPISSSTELIDFGAPDQPREIRIGSSLSPDERSRLIDLLRSYLDVFAWSYEDMPGLDPTIVQHHLPILPHARPVKQKLRRLHPRWSLQVKEEIQKQLSVGFLSVVEYPEWLANVVPVPKKDGKVRVCVDFRDLNKASPKDDFPLPHIDMLVDSTAGHPMLSFMDGFSGYNQILMAPEDMVKTSFITEWGTYCYRVMPFGLKNAGATYQRAATTLFHDMMHRDVEVYVDDMIVKSRDRADHLAALQRFFERIRQFRLRLNPKKCTFGVTSGKLLGHIVSERGRLQYISRFIARLTDICEPIFRLLRKNQPTVWNDDCQRAFERIKECLLSPPVLVPPTGRPLLLYLSVSDMALGCMLAQLDDLGKERAIYYLSKRMLEYECKYIMIERLCLAVVWATRRLRHYMTEYSVLLVSRLDPLRYLFDRPVLTGRLMRWLVLLTEFDIHYVTQKSVKGSIVADHLASLPISDDRSVDDDFPDEQIVSMTSITGWRLYFDGAANQSGFGIGILLISPQGDHIPRSVRLAFSDHHRLTNNIVEYEACITGLETALDLGIRQLEIHGDSNLVIKQTQGIWRTRDEKLKPYHAYLDLLIDRFDVLSLLCLIGEIEDQIELPWYHDIYQFLSCDAYPESASAKDRRALRQLATRFVVCGDALYRRSPDGLLLLCLDRASADRVMREVHAGVCGPHMGGHMLARKIMRTGYFWLTMETDCCQFVQRCQECQMHGDLIHVPPSELHALASPWPFSVWGIDIIGKISPKSSSGHEYILVAIDYFTKWVEAASYARLTAARVAKFIRSHIICRYGVPHELISDRGVHFKGEVDTLIQEYGIQHHRSSAYRPQTNGAVEAANKNIKRILRKMVETLGIVLPVEIEMRSLRVALEQHISEAEWAQSRYDQLSLLDEKRLRAADHVQAYQRKMTRAFRKRVKPRKFQRGDLVLKVLRGLISDPRGKFRPSWSGPYVIRDLTREGAAWLTDLDGNQFTEPVNVDQLKKFYA
ncbi:Retrovirus-related Pol polyprotein from transposon 17.6 [Vitis vinifera]|uniref:RNA-directed DNA polymerase n=1 Tax=Vitis vinifera TaxID=29760 RepID=A0A438GIY3_VITVI|nr:Retrovirus-related Pol polyprotein from transposon 17.6 [Vitis vinifera]RVW72132.1 Retrovirus-related Pol polyprotein from transposon 17.6 [Vitis vinifera]